MQVRPSAFPVATAAATSTAPQQAVDGALVAASAGDSALRASRLVGRELTQSARPELAFARCRGCALCAVGAGRLAGKCIDVQILIHYAQMRDGCVVVTEVE
jgi:hypothetical protein